MKKPNIVEIIRSENSSIIGQTANVIDIRCDKGEVDYRIVTNSGTELWVPSENTDIIS